jgi:RimJ/RimL family protein N-acetyltransferase
MVCQAQLSASLRGNKLEMSLEPSISGPHNLTRIEGPNLTLRLITTDDAAYVHGLRSDPLYNRHLSEVRGTVEDQREWIERYKVREASVSELYYVIERKDGQRCGLVRLYNIGIERFTWGSWILDKNKPRKAALESAVLVYTIAFELIGLRHAVFDVRKDNHNTLTFHRRFGAKETHEDDQDIYLKYSKEIFDADRDRYLSMLSEDFE